MRNSNDIAIDYLVKLFVRDITYLKLGNEHNQFRNLQFSLELENNETRVAFSMIKIEDNFSPHSYLWINIYKVDDFGV